MLLNNDWFPRLSLLRQYCFSFKVYKILPRATLNYNICFKCILLCTTTINPTVQERGVLLRCQHTSCSDDEKPPYGRPADPRPSTLGVYRSKIGPYFDLWRKAGVSYPQAPLV